MDATCLRATWQHLWGCQLQWPQLTYSEALLQWQELRAPYTITGHITFPSLPGIFWRQLWLLCLVYVGTQVCSKA